MVKIKKRGFPWKIDFELDQKKLWTSTVWKYFDFWTKKNIDLFFDVWKSVSKGKN